MDRFLATAFFSGCLLMSHSAFAGDPSQAAEVIEAGPADGLTALPAAPAGKPTLMGGKIEKIDPVRDQFTLDVPGGHPVKLLFDARTQLYRDGVKIVPGDLHAGDRASVETVLDGTSVFAVSIHMLSRPPQGECEGKVVRYDSRTRELTVSSALSREAIQLLVPAGTPVTRQDQAASRAIASGSSGFVAGTLVSVGFVPGRQGRGIAQNISVLATPGEVFVFTGTVSSLDLHSGLLVVADTRQDKSYQLSFNPSRLAVGSHLHVGDQVKVTASFDGARYVASAIDAG